MPCSKVSVNNGRLLRIEDFTSTAGRLVKNLNGDWTFAPNPLPPNLDFSVEGLRSLSEASLAIGQLSEAGRNLANPHLLIGSFQRREALVSSRIEGTNATAQELLLFEAEPAQEPRNPDVREVANYIRALEHGLVRLKELPISLRLIRELHGILLEGVRGENKRPGQFRNVQNWIGRTSNIADARYVPPSTAELHLALDAFEKYLHQPRSLPFLVDLALTHYQFEAIHPFHDGNGRVGRLLIILLLCEQNVLDQPILYLSPFFERHRDEYQDLMLRVSQRGEWENWVMFFLRGIAEQSRDGVQRARRISTLRQSYRDRLQKARASALLLNLVDQLFVYPAISVTQASKLLAVRYPSAQANVMRLVDAGILREHTGRQRGRIFVAPQIVELIEHEEQGL